MRAKKMVKFDVVLDANLKSLSTKTFQAMLAQTAVPCKSMMKRCDKC